MTALPHSGSLRARRSPIRALDSLGRPSAFLAWTRRSPPARALDSKTPKSTPGNPASPATAIPGDELSKRIVCIACGHSITHADARIERGGAHIHTRLNPEQVTFVFGCFSEAPGAILSGEATSFFTWFHGYQWRMASCGGCSAHLGWRFEGEIPFFALILDRLTGG